MPREGLAVGSRGFLPGDHEGRPCPECLTKRGIRARMGTARERCETCNVFAQRVMRLTRMRLKERYPEDYRELEEQTSRDLYPQSVEEYHGRVQKASALARSTARQEPR